MLSYNIKNVITIVVKLQHVHFDKVFIIDLINVLKYPQNKLRKVE